MNSNPDFWGVLLAHLSDAFGGVFSWLRDISHDEVQGSRMWALIATTGIAMVRALATGQGTLLARISRGVMDASMCGALLIPIVYTVDAAGISKNWVTAISGFIAWMGTEWARKAISAGASRVLDKVIGPGSKIDE